MILARKLPGRAPVITNAPGRLALALVRFSAWLDSYHLRRELAPLALPPARLDSRTLRPTPWKPCPLCRVWHP